MGPADFKVGDKVLFGRGNGEQTLGEITKKNPTKAKVKQLEARGTQKSYPVGTIWTVPYNLLKHADGRTPAAPGIDPADEPFEHNMFTESHVIHIMEAINDVYCSLSPENLSCDGEAPAHHVRQRYSELNRTLNGLFKALGRPVSETVAYNWLQNYREKRGATV